MSFEEFLSSLMVPTIAGIAGGLVVHWTFKNVQFKNGELQNKKYIKYPAIFFILISITSIIALFNFYFKSFFNIAILSISIIIGLIFLVVLLIDSEKILTHKEVKKIAKSFNHLQKLSA